MVSPVARFIPPAPAVRPSEESLVANRCTLESKIVRPDGTTAGWVKQEKKPDGSEWLHYWSGGANPNGRPADRTFCIQPGGV
jgi:hypothetical protein